MEKSCENCKIKDKYMCPCETRESVNDCGEGTDYPYCQPIEVEASSSKRYSISIFAVNGIDRKANMVEDKDGQWRKNSEVEANSSECKNLLDKLEKIIDTVRWATGEYPDAYKIINSLKEKIN